MMKLKMRRYIHTSLMTALLFGWCWMMTGCSSSDENDDQLDGQPLRVGSVTRTGEEEEEELEPNPLPWGDISLYIVSAEGDAYPKAPNQNGNIRYNGIGDSGDVIWNTSQLVVKPGRDYYVFGFMPTEFGTEPTVSLLSETSAKMTFSNLPTLTDQDFCIIVGVKEGQTPLGVSNQGSFLYHAPENTANGYYISLLAGHLYAAVEFRVTIDRDYNVLRKVMLTKMTLKCQNVEKSLLDTKITLTMNDQGTYPIVADPESTLKTGDGNERKFVLYSNDTGVELSPTEYHTFSGCFAEGCGTDLYLECEYKLCDRLSGENNDIETRTVKNSLSSLLKNLKRGRKKVINLKVDPTYLYQLSNGDVDK